MLYSDGVVTVTDIWHVKLYATYHRGLFLRDPASPGISVQNTVD